MKRVISSVGLTFALLVVAAAADFLLMPGEYVASLYAVPMLVTALLLPPRRTLVVVIAALLLAAFAAPLQPGSLEGLLGRLGGLVFAALLSYLLSSRIRSAMSLNEQLAAAKSRAEELAMQEHNLREQVEAQNEELTATNEELARIQQALLESQAMYQTLQDTIPDFVWSSNAEGRADYVNLRWQQYTGLTAEKLNAVGFPSVNHPDDAPRLEALWAEAAREGRPFEGEFRYKRHDGTYRWFWGRATPVKDQAGRVVRWVGVATDVHDRKQAEEERERLLAQVRAANSRLVATSMQAKENADTARKQAAQLSALLESLGESVTVVDASGSIVLRNEAARQLTVVPDNLAINGNDSGHIRIYFLDGTPVPFERWPANRLLRGERFDEEEYILERHDGTRCRVVSSGSLVRDELGNVALAIIVSRDVTALREMEQAREEQVHIISHDLRSPLTTLLGQAQLIERMADRPDTVRRSAQAIQTSARRMNLLIQDLVDSARLEGGQLALNLCPVDLPDFITGLRDRMASAASERQERISVEVPEGLPMVTADPDRLERIVTNLLTNALKYSPSDSPVRVSFIARDGEVVTSVSDNGQGIPAEDIPRLFQRFFRSSQPSQQRDGVGLGLYICRKLVEAHGGRIWCESEVGRGSTFRFTLGVAQRT